MGACLAASSHFLSQSFGGYHFSYYLCKHLENIDHLIPGKHPETAYFAYFSRQLGEKAYLCIRKIKNTGLFKPYAIIDQKTFDAEIQNLKK